MFKSKKIKYIFILCGIFLISGCSEKLDMSTGESASLSIEKILENKNEEEILMFQDAYETILGYSYTKTHEGKILTEENSIELLADIMSGDEKEIKAVDEMHKLADSILNGMTYEDVINAREGYEEKIFNLVDERNKRINKLNKEITR